MSEFNTGSPESLSPEQEAEMYRMVGSVAYIFAQLEQQSPVATFNPEVTRRGLVGRLHSEMLPDGRMAHIGLVVPSSADTLEAGKARHPTSDLSSILHRQHYELWVFPKSPSQAAPENYRFYQGTKETLPHIVEPEADGRGLRTLNPLSRERWDRLNAIVGALEQRTNG